MPVFATSGTKIFIGSAAIALKSADFIQSDFAAVTWTEIKEVDNVGSFGDGAAAVTFSPLSPRRDRILKGNRAATGMEVSAGIDYADPGQLALRAAEKTNGNYPFKVEFNDAPADGTPSARLFIAAVMSVAEAPDTANNVMKLNATLALNSNVVVVAADEGD